MIHLQKSLYSNKPNGITAMPEVNDISILNKNQKQMASVVMPVTHNGVAMEVCIAHITYVCLSSHVKWEDF